MDVILEAWYMTFQDSTIIYFLPFISRMPMLCHFPKIPFNRLWCICHGIIFCHLMSCQDAFMLLSDAIKCTTISQIAIKCVHLIRSKAHKNQLELKNNGICCWQIQYVSVVSSTRTRTKCRSNQSIWEIEGNCFQSMMTMMTHEMSSS